jgi:hypothetical protein
MARIRQTHEYEGKTADQGYAAAERALVNAGFEIWKKRPAGWLLMARRGDPKGTIQANIACRPGKKALVMVTLESESALDSELHEVAEGVLAEVSSQLGQVP